jgi:hypothetical protein
MNYNQKKLIQVINYNGDLEMLNFRLKEHFQVNYFLIAESLYDTNGNKKENLFIRTKLYEDNKQKIIYLTYNNDFNEKISEKLISFCGNFEDIVIVSEEHEFADLTKINEIEEKVDGEFFFLKHRNYWWGINLQETEDHFGSIVFSFSHLLCDKNILNTMSNLRKETNFSSISLLNGWSFNYFFKKPDDSDFYIKKRLPYKTDNVRLILKNDDEGLPVNFNLLPKITEPLMKQKILIIVDNCFVPNNTEVFDAVIYVNYVHEPKLSTEKNIFNFLLPTSSLYGTESYDKFIDNYKLNEINQILIKVCVSDDDCIVLRFKDEMIVFNYSDVTRRPISTLKNPS